MNRTTRHLCRRLIASFVERRGYVVAGGHIFTQLDWFASSDNSTRMAVLENQENHSFSIVRAAWLLLKTYTP